MKPEDRLRKESVEEEVEKSKGILKIVRKKKLKPGEKEDSVDISEVSEGDEQPRKVNLIAV